MIKREFTKKTTKKIIAYALAFSLSVSGFVYAYAYVSDNGAPGEPPALSADGMPGQPPTGSGDGMPGEPPSGSGMGGPGSSSSNITWTGATTISSDTTETDTTYSSTTADQNALLVTGGNVTLNNITATKTGDSDGGDNCNFYGTNSAITVKDKANVTITGANVTADATGANGIFCYGGNGGQNGAAGDGTTVTIKDSTITTTGNNGGGIMTTGGGTTNAYNLTINTSGTSSAAIRTDRGGGTVVVDKGTYNTTGVGSPAIYSTADITVSNATLSSTQSEGIVIEGKNSVTLKNTDVTASNVKLNGQATNYQGVMLYQSMSGDSAEGTSSFSMTGGTFTNKNGDVFYITNTSSEINLENATIINEDSDNVLFNVSGYSNWGTKGSNGGSANVTASNQVLNGNVNVDDISTMTLTLNNGSTFTGAFTNQNAKQMSLKVSKDSSVTLTADSYVTSLDVAEGGKIYSNGYTLYVNGVAYTGSALTNESAPQTTESSVSVTSTSITNVKSTASKKAKVTWKAVEGADGYRITLTSGKTTKTVTVSGGKKTSTTVKKLKSKKTYKVTVQAYKVVSGKKVYSAKSSVKKVKVK